MNLKNQKIWYNWVQSSMKKKVLAVVLIVIILVVFGSVTLWVVFFRFPNTLTPGEDPVILLPMQDFSHNTNIGGYGQVSPEYFHNGIDFGVNGTTAIVAPHAAYVEDVKFWFNDRGGHWQTNVRLWLNYQWKIEIVFESWALNETYGQLQRDEIVVNVGQYVEANQTLGNLISHGSSTHIHFGIYSNNDDKCPYIYFSTAEKAVFEAQFALVNFSAHWCM